MVGQNGEDAPMRNALAAFSGATDGSVSFSVTIG
jgi:hypothetical protein